MLFAASPASLKKDTNLQKHLQEILRCVKTELGNSKRRRMRSMLVPMYFLPHTFQDVMNAWEETAEWQNLQLGMHIIFHKIPEEPVLWKAALEHGFKTMEYERRREQVRLDPVRQEPST